MPMAGLTAMMIVYIILLDAAGAESKAISKLMDD